MIKPAIIISIALGVILLTIILVSNLKITSLSISLPEANPTNLNSHAWTKAICDKDNLCQDYLIECKGQETLKISPITGSVVKFDASWQDPRTLENRERLCD